MPCYPINSKPLERCRCCNEYPRAFSTCGCGYTFHSKQRKVYEAPQNDGDPAYAAGYAYACGYYD